MNIRARFTLLFAIIVGIILSVFSFAIYYLSEDYRINDFHSRLQDRAITRFKLFEASKGATEISPSISAESTDPLSMINEKIIIYDSDKNLIYRDTAARLPSPEIINSVIKSKTYAVFKENEEHIGFIYPYKGNTYILFAAAHDEHGMKYTGNLKRILTVRGIIIMVIIVFIGWMFAGRFLKPISKIVLQADKITYSNLNYRLKNVNTNDEISRLVETFNKMLERLETSFKIQKRFVSNASHELRNPLTAISGQIDVALMKERTHDEYKAVLNSISKEIKNIRTLANNLLELANSEAESIFQEPEEIRIDEILWNIRDEIAKQNPDYKVHIHFDKLVDNHNLFTCKGKEKLLKIAFINIINNACKFSNDKRVEVKVTSENKNIILFFKDKGIGIPEAYLSHIFEPFSRGDNAQSIPGNGIGLSLTQRIIKLHSGKISIRSKLNEGTTVEVVLPNLS